MMSLMINVDPEMGVVRLCGECEEEWPDDEEFYAPGSYYCIACETERIERRRASVREAARRYRDRQRGAP